MSGNIQQTDEALTPDRGTLLRQAYGAASTRLRDTHHEEFDRLYIEEAKARGIEYKPKATPEQKAEAEMRRLLAEFPHLAEKIGDGE